MVAAKCSCAAAAVGGHAHSGQGDDGSWSDEHNYWHVHHAVAKDPRNHDQRVFMLEEKQKSGPLAEKQQKQMAHRPPQRVAPFVRNSQNMTNRESSTAARATAAQSSVRRAASTAMTCGGVDGWCQGRDTHMYRHDGGQQRGKRARGPRQLA
jgi:hypothetical protein